MQGLKALANKYTTPDGAVTFYMLPYFGVRANVVVNELARETPQSQWGSAHYSFMELEALTVDVEFNATESVPAYAERLKSYWKARNGSVSANWEMYQYVVDNDGMNAILEAYSATREKELLAPEGLTESPEAQGNVSKL